MLRSVSGFFWVTAIAVLACFAFFVLLGAWDPLEVLPLSIAALVLLALWAARVLLGGPGDTHDPTLLRQRERRGF